MIKQEKDYAALLKKDKEKEVKIQKSREVRPE